MIFDSGPRDSFTHAVAGESRFGFLNRSATLFFGEVRQLLEDWLAQVPAEHRADFVGRMRSGSDERFEAAFWELYLHEAYRRSGAGPVIHPDVPGTTHHPDFAVTLNGHRAYIEAVRVGATLAKAGEQARLAAVEAVLESMPTSTVRLQFNWHRIGETSLATRKLKFELTRWLAGLDHAEIVRTAKANGGSFTGPTLPWRDGGWHLSFTALPVTPRPRTGLIGARGPGRATGVDNVTGLRRVLDAKANKYGTSLDAPLTIAVLSNTDYPTRWYSVAEALYGLSSGTPAQSAADPERLSRDGHWLTRRGWRRAHTPQVILAAGLSPWRIRQTRSQLWQTLEPAVHAPAQPGWLDLVDATEIEPTIQVGSALHALFGLPADWLARDPEFRS